MAVSGRLPPREATKLKFGRLAIGTMTFGAQTPSQQAFEIGQQLNGRAGARRYRRNVPCLSE